jgi:hypothetical protein
MYRLIQEFYRSCRLENSSNFIEIPRQQRREWRAAAQTGNASRTADYKHGVCTQILSFGVLHIPQERFFISM